ncbi:unnamed protein product [Colias eurytheme]|nr:unnamed protein product [Colias eurytheme]
MVNKLSRYEKNECGTALSLSHFSIGFADVIGETNAVRRGACRNAKTFYLALPKRPTRAPPAAQLDRPSQNKTQAASSGNSGCPRDIAAPAYTRIQPLNLSLSLLI